MIRLLDMTLHLKEPSYTDDAGNLYPGMMEPIQGKWCTTVNECDHKVTACFACLDAWSQEYTGVIHTSSKDITLEEAQAGLELAKIWKRILKL